MMMTILICIIALLASLLTFFSGFGLGTLLLPAFALFMPVEQAVAATAVVHGLNGVFKLFLVRTHVDRRIVLRFGAPAVLAAIMGAWLLLRIGALPALHAYTLFAHRFEIVPIKLVVGLLLMLFAIVELVPRFRNAQFDTRWLPLGGMLSGFFGGLAGMQGALRSAFLARNGLDKQAFVATGAAIACLIDLTRLSVYTQALSREFAHLDRVTLALAVLSAFVGAYLGNRLLQKITMAGIQRLVGALLFVFAIGLMSGVL